MCNRWPLTLMLVSSEKRLCAGHAELTHKGHVCSDLRRARAERLHMLGTYSCSQISEVRFPDTFTRKRSTLMIRTWNFFASSLAIQMSSSLLHCAINKRTLPMWVQCCFRLGPTTGRIRGDIAMNFAPVLCVVLVYDWKDETDHTPRCAMPPDRRSAVAQNSSARVAQATDMQTKNCSPSESGQKRYCTAWNRKSCRLQAHHCHLFTPLPRHLNSLEEIPDAA